MSDFAEYLASYVPDRLVELKVPGVSIALIEQGELRQTCHFGFADIGDRRPLDDDTLFQIASISKSVAAWGVMKLVERGLLDLDAPVERYLSRWQFPPSEFDSSAVTARLLLMHFAGTSLSGCGGSPYDAPWSTVGETRRHKLSDNSSVCEELTSFAQEKTFAYRLTEFTGALSPLVSHARAEWHFTQGSILRTRIDWTYIFVPAGPLAEPFLWFIVKLFWPGYLKAALARVKAKAEAGTP